jgi:hypothetical protein
MLPPSAERKAVHSKSSAKQGGIAGCVGSALESRLSTKEWRKSAVQPNVRAVMGMDVKVECFFPKIRPPGKAVGDVPLYLSMGIRDQMPLIWERLCHRWESAPVLKNQA